MATIEELHADREKLIGALSTGVRKIMHRGKLIEYATTSEMQSTLSRLDREIAALQGRRTTTFLPHFSKGL